jgi:hypothetical protein
MARTGRYICQCLLVQCCHTILAMQTGLRSHAPFCLEHKKEKCDQACIIKAYNLGYTTLQTGPSGSDEVLKRKLIKMVCK